MKNRLYQIRVGDLDRSRLCRGGGRREITRAFCQSEKPALRVIEGGAAA